MLKIDNSQWFYEFEYNGEVKRIHRFKHLPLDFVLENKGASDVLSVFDALLRRDCGLSVSDLDAQTGKELLNELSGEGASLGE